MAPWLLAMISGKRRVVTETFTSSQTWVCPFGVSLLNTLTGEGQDGSSPSTPSANDMIINVTYQTSGSSGGGPVTWANFDSQVDGWVSTLNSTGSVTYTRALVDAYPDESALVTSSSSVPLTGVVPGSAYKVTFGAWASSGAITASGDAAIYYNYYLAGAAGANTTGFGYTFAGGAASTAATPVEYLNVPVTGGASYALVVPAGGSITITYFR